MDRVQIEVVLRNLVANALEAAASGSTPDACVKVRAEARNAEVVLEVRDSGRGVSSEELRTIFDSRRSSKPGGMGIGLFISRAIVEAHEGRLWAEAGPGGAFFFSLPTQAGKDGE
jgi:signal transduction histidine kinase